MGKEKLMEKEIEEKRKLTDEVKNKIDKNVFYNFLMAISIMIFMFAINFLYIKSNIIEFKFYIKFFTMFISIVTIVLFEIAYRKESGKYAITGIEFLVLSVLVLYIPYVYINKSEVVRKLMMLIPIYFGVYYSFKNYFIYRKEELNYKNNLSDVKEIVKKEKADYLDDKKSK